MPKQVFDGFFRAMVRDIKNQYHQGNKYLSIREIADKYQVSVQTAHKGVKKLEEYGYITVKRKAGITVECLRPQKKLEGYKIAVVSARADTRFNDAFLKGIREVAGRLGVIVGFEQINEPEKQSLQFGEHLVSLDADGIIALSFRHSDLAFYHVIREGLDIVADVILDGLPVLPAVQTNNYRHAQEAGRIFVEQGYRRFLVVGYGPLKKNRRYEGMYDAIQDHCDEVQYVCLTDLGSINKIDEFFNRFNKYSAVFSVDYSASYIVGAKFTQHGITVKKDNFLVYDCEKDFFEYNGISMVRKVGPSMADIGSELCKTLIHKRETGAYPLPLQRKI
jgi:DNA-binding LacI/PurR family transcriptional regulator